MVNEEIVGGLKSALERGQTLERAMMAFYNSGYKKEEIEEAARVLMEFRQEAQIQPPIRTVPRTNEIKQAPQILTPPKRLPQQFEPMEFQPPTPMRQALQKPILQQPVPIPVSKPVPMQKVSNYGEEASREKIKEKVKHPKERAIIFVLVFLLIFLIGLLGVIFFFKDQLIDFFSNFFG